MTDDRVNDTLPDALRALDAVMLKRLVDHGVISATHPGRHRVYAPGSQAELDRIGVTTANVKTPAGQWEYMSAGSLARAIAEALTGSNDA